MASPGIVRENRVILFTDVHDFSVALSVLAEDLYSFLQEMYEVLGEIIVGHQGEIVKYIGDGMLCIFPAGSENEVVACSLRLRKDFLSIASLRGLPPDTQLEVGIGSGEVVTGVFGHRSLGQRDVFGEEVNLAATIGHHRGIAVTEGVHNVVKMNYETRRLPDFSVKWQDEPLKVWEVVE